MSAAVIACGALALDVRAIARRRGWDIEVIPVDALLHNHPERIAGAVAAALRARSDVVAVAYADCGTYGALDGVLAGVPRLAGDTCYDVLARDEVREAMADEPGTYFLTDFLARTFRHTVVRELGLDRWPQLREDYFGHYTRVLWLAQRPTPATRACAQDAAAFLRLPLEVRDVGVSGLERALERVIRDVVQVKVEYQP
ncbi:MAG: DUF1638 domain-containing protein [Solirubrobacteraceae bacterium]